MCEGRTAWDLRSRDFLSFIYAMRFVSIFQVHFRVDKSIFYLVPDFIFLWPRSGQSRWHDSSGTVWLAFIFWYFIFTARNEVGARLCFYTCLWFCSQGGGLLPGGLPGPGMSTTGGWSATRGGAWSQGGLLPGGCLVQGGGLLPGVCRERPMMATAAGSTHPTGMHSCLCYISSFIKIFCFVSIPNFDYN